MENKIKVCFFCHGNRFQSFKNPVFTGFYDMTKETLGQIWASNDLQINKPWHNTFYIKPSSTNSLWQTLGCFKRLKIGQKHPGRLYTVIQGAFYVNSI